MATSFNALEIGNVTELQLRLSKLARQFPQAGAITIALTDAQQKIRVVTTASPCDGVRIPVGCMAKLFTSALLSRGVLGEKIRPDVSIVALLPISEEKVRRQLRGVTVAHLLNHTHGLDDTALGPVPLLSNGRIDCNALCAQMVSAPPLFAPGELYNYGHAGGYLAGAVLEQLYEMPFASVLETNLLEPLGLQLLLEEGACMGDTTRLVCPSTGGDWCVTEVHVLKLLAQQLATPHSTNPPIPAAQLAMMQACSRRLPGWSATEESINFGWKGYGWDWYGHDARAPKSSMLARINVKHRVALVISCVGFSGIDPSYVLLSRLFRDSFPELTRIDAPRLIDEAAAQGMDLDAFTGTYRTRAATVEIGRSDRELFVRLEGQGDRPHRLIAAADNLFRTAPAVRDVFPIVQFIRPTVDGRHEYLWNGQNVWRRCS